ncbi:MAG: hypothetical protein GX944_03255 [Alphaproteobacteria bacterium]|nr:hypothetical protein [Alphaproteobacteria bacterium]
MSKNSQALSVCVLLCLRKSINFLELLSASSFVLKRKIELLSESVLSESVLTTSVLSASVHITSVVLSESVLSASVLLCEEFKCVDVE